MAIFTAKAQSSPRNIKTIIFRFIKTARKPQAFKPGDEWQPGGPTDFVGPQARGYGMLW
jgi:hypothetical protein